MKKRLLITSIVMMLVVAVALSTATYAWFTSNAYVTASTVSFTAATSDADSIAIAWTGNTDPGTTLTAATAGTNMKPMVPASLEDGVTTSAGISFTTGTLYSNNGVPTFNTEDHSATPITWQTADNGADPAAAAQSFYVKNMSLANTVHNIKVTATIADVDDTDEIAADELVRVAIFTRDLGTGGVTAASGNYLLRGVLSKNGGDTAVRTITNNGVQTTVVDADGYTATAAATGFNICKISGSDSTLAANNQVDIVVIVWMDGEALTDSTAGVAASVELRFDAVPAPVEP